MMMRTATREEYAKVVRTLPHEACKMYEITFPPVAYAMWFDGNGECVAKATYLPAVGGDPAIKTYEVKE
jgi:hypothetical protein